MSENQLSNDLFTRDLIQLLMKFRNYLINFITDCNCDENIDYKNYFQILDNEYNSLIDSETVNGFGIKVEVNAIDENEDNLEVETNSDEVIARDNTEDDTHSNHYSEDLSEELSTEVNDSDISDDSFIVIERKPKRRKTSPKKSSKVNANDNKISLRNITINELKQLVANNQTIECQEKSSESIAAYKLRPTVDSDRTPIVGYGCKTKGCLYIACRREYVAKHITKGKHKRVKELEDKTSKPLIVSKKTSNYTQKEIKEIVARKDCLVGIHVLNKSVKVYYKFDSDGRKDIIGFGCNLIGCEALSKNFDNILRHFKTRQHTVNSLEEDESTSEPMIASEESENTSDSQTLPLICCNSKSTQYKCHEIRERVANNHCYTGLYEKNKWIKVFYTNEVKGLGKHIIGFGCRYLDCNVVTNRLDVVSIHLEEKHSLNVSSDVRESVSQSFSYVSKHLETMRGIGSEVSESEPRKRNAADSD